MAPVRQLEDLDSGAWLEKGAFAPTTCVRASHASIEDRRNGLGSHAGATTTTATRTDAMTYVEGHDKDGSADSGRPPVKVGGVDASGNVQTLTVGTDGSLPAVGDVASGAADSGNPVKVGGKYNATFPTLLDGQRGDLQLGPRGQAAFMVVDAPPGASPQGIASARVSAFDVSTVYALNVNAFTFQWDGSTYVLRRGNTDLSLLASAARTALASSADQTNYNGRGVAIVVNVTVEGAATLTLTVQGKDSVSGNYYDLITGIVVYTAATDTPPTTRAVVLYPGTLTADTIGIAGATGTTSKQVVLPRTWRVTVTPADATTTTYSVSGVTLL